MPANPLSLAPFDEKYLPGLRSLRDERQNPDTLREELTDDARGKGSQVAIILEKGLPIGVAGWVTYGIASEGVLYGSPFLAGNEAAARLLLDHLVAVAQEWAARELRVSCYPREIQKANALVSRGFTARLDMIGMERSCLPISALPMPDHLERVIPGTVDWERFSRFFNDVFSTVPHAPPLSPAMLAKEWETMDPRPSQIWINEEGQYQAWIGARADGYVDSIGVHADERGKGLAQALYRMAAEAFMDMGVTRMHTLLASTNTATLRLHERLGFCEFDRRTAYSLKLKA